MCRYSKSKGLECIMLSFKIHFIMEIVLAVSLITKLGKEKVQVKFLFDNMK